MSVEREQSSRARMPVDFSEQIEIFRNLDALSKDSRGLSYRFRICEALERKIRFRLGLFGMSVITYGFRPKTIESIEAKIAKRRPDSLINDAFGIRHIFTTQAERTFAGRVVQSIFPLTPKFLPNGMPTFRDYADPAMKDFIRQNFNPNLYQQGSALHVNFIFRVENLDTLFIGEYQAMTSAEDKIYRTTHEEYKNGMK